MEARRSTFVILPLLGALSVVSPFSIDMYLTAYAQVAGEFDVPTNVISLTLSAYFIGLASGQLFYGPVLDRFGRKPPLAFGLTVFLLASLGCAVSTDIRMLIVLRFIQGVGGCGAQVASLAMVTLWMPHSWRRVSSSTAPTTTAAGSSSFSASRKAACPKKSPAISARTRAGRLWRWPPCTSSARAASTAHAAAPFDLNSL